VPAGDLFMRRQDFYAQSADSMKTIQTNERITNSATRQGSGNAGSGLSEMGVIHLGTGAKPANVFIAKGGMALGAML